MNLQAIVEKYLAIAGAFGRPAALASFGLDRAEVERVFGALDEDYQISRYFHFTCDSGSRFRINDFEQTHISIDAKIRDIL